MDASQTETGRTLRTPLLHEAETTAREAERTRHTSYYSTRETSSEPLSPSCRNVACDLDRESPDQDNSSLGTSSALVAVKTALASTLAMPRVFWYLCCMQISLSGAGTCVSLYLADWQLFAYGYRSALYIKSGYVCVAYIAAMFASPLLGALSDYYGRKPVMVACAVCCWLSFAAPLAVAAVWNLEHPEIQQLRFNSQGGVDSCTDLQQHALATILGTYQAFFTPQQIASSAAITGGVIYASVTDLIEDPAQRELGIGLLSASVIPGAVLGMIGEITIGTHNENRYWQVWMASTVMCSPLVILTMVFPETQPAQAQEDNRAKKGEMFTWYNLNPFRSLERLWGSRLLSTLAIVLFMLQWTVDGFVDATLNYLVDRGFFGAAPAALVLWLAAQIIIGVLFWLPWFQRNMTRKNALVTISAAIGAVSAALCFSVESLKPWYPYVVGGLISPIFVLLPLTFNWATEQIESDDEAGEVIGALTSVRACSGIIGAFLPAGLALSGRFCGSHTDSSGCGGGPPTYLWNCVWFGFPWLIGSAAAMIAILIVKSRIQEEQHLGLSDSENTESFAARDDSRSTGVKSEPRRITGLALMPGVTHTSRVHPSIVYGQQSQYCRTTRHTVAIASDSSTGAHLSTPMSTPPYSPNESCELGVRDSAIFDVQPTPQRYTN